MSGLCMTIGCQFSSSVKRPMLNNKLAFCIPFTCHFGEFNYTIYCPNITYIYNEKYRIQQFQKNIQSVNEDVGSSCNDILQIKNLIIIIYKAYRGCYRYEQIFFYNKRVHYVFLFLNLCPILQTDEHLRPLGVMNFMNNQGQHPPITERTIMCITIQINQYNIHIRSALVEDAPYGFTPSQIANFCPNLLNAL